MAQPYVKPWLSVADQLQQLIDRGMVVSDVPKALACLERIGYYRLSGYWYAFRERSEICCVWDPSVVGKPKKITESRIPLEPFKPGASFHGEAHRLARPFLLLCMAQHLMQQINPTSTWGSRLKDLLLNDFPPLDHLNLNLLGMGVDPGWDTRAW
jgi:abortive infection bacteriophage resistance protein